MRNDNCSDAEQHVPAPEVGAPVQVNGAPAAEVSGPNFARLFVRHEFVSPILTAVQEVIEIYREEHYPKNLLIMGPARSGKSRLVEKICGYGNPIPNQRFPIKTIFASEVPSPASIKGLVTMLLYSLGVADPERGNVTMQTARLIRLVQSLKIEMLVLDEFQHLVENRSYEVIEGVAEWVKTLIQKKKCEIDRINIPYLRNRSGDLTLWYLLPLLIQHGYELVGEPVVVTADKALHRLMFRVLPPVLHESRAVAFSVDPREVDECISNPIQELMSGLAVSPNLGPAERNRRLKLQYDLAAQHCLFDEERQELMLAWKSWTQPGTGLEMAVAGTSARPDLPEIG
jgi:hypothetical protein